MQGKRLVVRIVTGIRRRGRRAIMIVAVLVGAVLITLVIGMLIGAFVMAFAIVIAGDRIANQTTDHSAAQTSGHVMGGKAGNQATADRTGRRGAAVIMAAAIIGKSKVGAAQSQQSAG